MATKWYPFIVKSKCTGCIACVEFCEYSVLEERDNKAHIISKDNCIEGCKDCQKYGVVKPIYFPDEQEEMIKDGLIKCTCEEHI